ncbi:MAG: hypothetical protein DMG96_35925 [Acidobacteria bacterium]|nr:MAG: hypothetical protein DMG96_35925 [Acidobacteriota bacterium]
MQIESRAFHAITFEWAPRYCRLFGFNQIPLLGVKMYAMSGHLEWISLYRAALRETDPDKLQTRIEEAEQAMRLALRSAVEYEDSDQRHTIGEALRHLETVQQSSKDAGQSGATPSERQR